MLLEPRLQGVEFGDDTLLMGIALEFACRQKRARGFS